MVVRSFVKLYPVKWVQYHGEDMYLSVVIPAYNEAKRIGATLQAVCSWLAEGQYDAEVIVVDNNSTDATADVVRDAHAPGSCRRLARLRSSPSDDEDGAADDLRP